MKILQIIPSLGKGGAERLVLDICCELKNRTDIEVALVVFSTKNEYEFISKNISVSILDVKVIPSLTGKMEVDVKALQSFIEIFKPDIIHSHLFETEMVLSQISYPNALYFVHFHDNMKQFKQFTWNVFLSKKNITNYFERKLVLNGYRGRKVSFIGISDHACNFIKSNLPKHFSKSLLHNAINTARFSDGIKDRGNLRIVMIGSLVDKKGQDLAIDTVKILHERNILVKLDLLGDGPNYKQLQDKIADYQLSDHIVLHGNVSYPEEFLNGSRVYLHTAIYEPFGLVFIEAMASGLPIVCTDAKGNRDLIVEGVNGFMVKKRDPELLADKIEILLKDEVIWASMSSNAVEMSKQYDIKRYTDNLLELYEKNL
jgi:glycosyltransferase involved in cell wall biosynthesis